MSSTLLDDVQGLLQRGRELLPPDERVVLDEAVRRLKEPLRVAIAGRIKAGKSTLLNALVGEELAPTDASECTRIVTWYRNGLTYEVLGHLRDGSTTKLQFQRTDRAVTVELGQFEPESMEHLEVRWPSGRLEGMTLIDTPGTESLSRDVAARTEEFLEGEEGEESPADALLYLMQHTHPGDVRLLEAFQDDDLGRGSPVNAIGVLSRADEIGSCRLDALKVAEAATARYLATPDVRRLCLTAVPVAGLAAQAGATLTEQQFQWLATLAQLGADDLAAVLLTGDRVAERPEGAAVPEAGRRELLDRIGLFAIRFSVDAIRTQRVSSSRQLAAELLEASGLPALRDVLSLHFDGRSRVLKARTGLAALERSLRSRANETEPSAVLRDVERLRAGVHEFAEIRILTALRSGLVEVDEDRATQLERILGGDGDKPAIRLGLDESATDRDLMLAAGELLDRWRRVADHPLAARSLVDAAVAAARSCEGMLAELYAKPSTTF